MCFQWGAQPLAPLKKSPSRRFHFWRKLAHYSGSSRWYTPNPQPLGGILLEKCPFAPRWQGDVQWRIALIPEGNPEGEVRNGYSREFPNSRSKQAWRLHGESRDGHGRRDACRVGGDRRQAGPL